jgi:hypothetical protein
MPNEAKLETKPEKMTTEDRDRLGGPPALVAIIRAARAIGDRELERAARERLATVYGIEISFRRQKPAEAATP